MGFFLHVRRPPVQELPGLPDADCPPGGPEGPLQRLRALLAADGALVAHLLALVRADTKGVRGQGVVKGEARRPPRFEQKKKPERGGGSRERYTPLQQQSIFKAAKKECREELLLFLRVCATR